MGDPTHSRCQVPGAHDAAGAPTVAGLPVCAGCLQTLIDEPDPRRRRSLARSPRLPIEAVQRLARDPDPQVRAGIAARRDLPSDTATRLSDATVEDAPVVWRSLAATPAGAANATRLLGTDDPDTLVILAANPDVEGLVLEQLSDYADPAVAWTARGSLSGQPPVDDVGARIDRARAFDGLPIVGADRHEEPGPDAAPADAPPPARRRGMSVLLTGAIVLIVAAVVVVAVAFIGSGSDDRTLAIEGGPPTTGATAADDDAAGVTPTTSPATEPERSTSTVAETTTTTEPEPTTTTTTVAPVTTSPPTTDPPAGPVRQDFTIVATVGRMCKQARVVVDHSPDRAEVTVADDSGEVVAGWKSRSGQTKRVKLPRPTRTLQVTVTAIGHGIQASGSASADAC